MSAVVERIKSEARFFGNTIREAFLHPLSTTVIDKRTGKVLTAVGSTRPPGQLGGELDLRLLRMALASSNLVELRHLLRPILSDEEIPDGDVPSDEFGNRSE